MHEWYYEMIFKRKSFHRFSGTSLLSGDEIKEIQNHIQCLQPLMDGIRTEFRLVPREGTTCKRGHYCILIYSEVKEHHLLNVGYMGQQLDLWLASKNIGACWYGMGRTHEKQHNGLDFVIMIAIEKADEKDFRKDYTKAKRKELSEIWMGNAYQKMGSVARYAPSACNTQPWLAMCEKNQLHLYRVKGKKGMMPKDKVTYYNKIDMGIFMLFLELCLEHEKISYVRKLYPDTLEDKEKILTAAYFMATEGE